MDWRELFPDQFLTRIKHCPVVYLPMGLCEAHGQISALGLDTFKAEHLCRAAARSCGGIVAPTMEYHVHESGPSAKFMEEQVGEHNACMTSVPPHILFHFFLYQLRCFYNAGFRAVIVVSGHGGSHPDDIRRVAQVAMKYMDLKIWIGTDFDLAGPQFPPDHAGKYEISTLMHLRPDLVDRNRMKLANDFSLGGRFALADNAEEAYAEYGEQILSAAVSSLINIARSFAESREYRLPEKLITYEQIEHIWFEAIHSVGEWQTLQPRLSQPPVSPASRWKPFEKSKISYDLKIGGKS